MAETGYREFNSRRVAAESQRNTERRKAVAQAHANCTWGNTTETVEDWLRILQSGTAEEHRRLFNKIFSETSDTRLITQIFDAQSIGRFLRDLERPMFKPHIERRRKVWRYLYCDIKEAIPELDWVERKRT